MIISMENSRDAKIINVVVNPGFLKIYYFPFKISSNCSWTLPFEAAISLDSFE
jgi:hypothetical protein